MRLQMISCDTRSTRRLPSWPLASFELGLSLWCWTDNLLALSFFVSTNASCLFRQAYLTLPLSTHGLWVTEKVYIERGSTVGNTFMSSSSFTTRSYVGVSSARNGGGWSPALLPIQHLCQAGAKGRTGQSVGTTLFFVELRETFEDVPLPSNRNIARR